MQQEQIFLYLRENMMTVTLAAGGIILFIWLFILFQVTRTRREVHKICKKIYRYFEVILAEDAEEKLSESESAVENMQVPACPVQKEELQQETQKTQGASKAEEEVQLLMDVISDVF